MLLKVFLLLLKDFCCCLLWEKTVAERWQHLIQPSNQFNHQVSSKQQGMNNSQRTYFTLKARVSITFLTIYYYYYQLVPSSYIRGRFYLVFALFLNPKREKMQEFFFLHRAGKCLKMLCVSIIGLRNAVHKTILQESFFISQNEIRYMSFSVLNKPHLSKMIRNY